jgi:hypothetical protein
MYFTRGNGSVYHILAYPSSGSAPPPCGTKLDRYDLSMYLAGKLTPNIVTEKPSHAKLCKHCEAAAHRSGSAP